MDYGRNQIVKLLKLQGKSIKYTGRTYGEDVQAKFLNHQYDMNHKMYKNKKSKKLNKQQKLHAKFEIKYSKVLFNIKMIPANYKKIDNLLNTLAKSQGGVLKLSQLRRLLLPHIDGDAGYKAVSNYLSYENYNNPSAFIKGYNKLMPNVIAILNVLATGFLGNQDIKKDMSLRSIKQATYMLRPVNEYIKNGNDKSIGSWENHFSIKNIVKVHNIVQDKPSEHKLVKYGVNKPQRVISTEEYLYFLNVNYKSVHKTPKYVKSHYTKEGQMWYKAIKDTKPSQRLDRIIRVYFERSLLENELRIQTRIAALCLDRIDHPDKLLGLDKMDKFHLTINHLIHSMADYHNQMSSLKSDGSKRPFRKLYATGTKSKLMNKCVYHKNKLITMNPLDKWSSLRSFL